MSFPWTYEFFTAEDTPFEDKVDLPESALVTTDDWCVSYTSLDRVLSAPEVVAEDDGKVMLRIHRPFGGYGPGGDKHPLYGTKYDTRRDASKAAYEAGALKFMVKVPTA